MAMDLASDLTFAYFFINAFPASSSCLDKLNYIIILFSIKERCFLLIDVTMLIQYALHIH